MRSLSVCVSVSLFVYLCGSSGRVSGMCLLLMFDVDTPKINCTSPVVITVNQTRAMLRCTVYGNPTVNYSTWNINKGNMNIVKVVSSSRVSINPLSSDDYEVVDTVRNHTKYFV